MSTEFRRASVLGRVRANKRDVQSSKRPYSITSAAIASSAGSTVMPSALAVLLHVIHVQPEQNA